MSNQDDFRRVVRMAVLTELLKEAESQEHKRLKNDLREFAEAYEYSAHLSRLPSGKVPDVLSLNETGRYLFVGDAKVSANEGPGRSETVNRVFSYFTEFAAVLLKKQIDGGILAIATDDEEKATAWCTQLNFMASLADLTTASGASADFKVRNFKEKTFVVFW